MAVTHSDWFDFLAHQRRREEVNFWSPSDYYTFHGTPGAPFFFKLKSPRNAIGGFGYVASFSRLPDWLAWECFGDGNGAATFEDFKRRLDTLRERNRLRGAGGLSQIGCIVLVQAVFFTPEQWVPQPADWAVRNLRYTRYNLDVGEGARIWRECQERAAGRDVVTHDVLVVRKERPRYGEPVLMRPRLGQGAFRVVVTDAYKRACAVTHEHSLPVLEAAHIVPYAQGGAHEVSNGLLLRSDLHRLFDLGYVTVTPELYLEVSGRPRGEFENGRTYYPMHGTPVNVPADPRLRPDPNVARRTREIGIRMALGARRSMVLRRILQETVTVSVAGILIGLAGALATTRLVAAFLFELSPRDPSTLLATAVVLMATTMAAGWLPARRAAAVDPMRALRNE